MDFPEPVISVAIEPKTKADQEKLGGALAKLAQEDPTFKVHTDPDTGQTIISGMGELHLEIIVDRLVREFGVGANVGKPQVAYQETIRRPPRRRARYIRQTGGRGQYGHVKIAIEPLPAGGGFVFDNEIVGGVIPKEFIRPVETGIREAMESGVLAGYRGAGREGPAGGRLLPRRGLVGDGVQDRGFHGLQGGRRPRAAGAPGAGDAVEVVVPEQYMGEVIGDLNARRGRIESTWRSRAGTQVITARCPLSEMFGYATDLRSMTQGRATYTMHFSHYDEAPKNISEERHRPGPGSRQHLRPVQGDLPVPLPGPMKEPDGQGEV